MTKKKNVYEVDMEQSSEEIKEEDLDQELLKELRKEWEAYPNLRKEFLDDFYNFYFFRDAELKGLIKFDPDIHKMIDHLKQHPFRHLLVVKEFANEITSMYGGKGRRGYKGPIPKTLEMYIKKYGDTTFEELLNAMEDDTVSRQSI